MSKYEAGKEVLSYCGKCKLALAHVIVSMKDTNTFGKVQCKTCGATHAYKDPATKAKKVKSKPRVPGGKTKSISVGELWTEELAKANGKAKTYSIRETFIVVVIRFPVFVFTLVYICVVQIVIGRVFKVMDIM